MIDLVSCNGNVLVFDPDDWGTLRRTHRIVGTLVGNTNTIQTLPLKLLSEEVLLLVDKRAARVVERHFDVTPEDQQAQQKFENDLLEAQRVVYKDLRKRQLEVMISDIVAAKRKRGDDRSSEDIFSEELEKSSLVNKENMTWPIALTSPHCAKTTELSRESILNTTSDLKYSVYKDLWERGYYITTGFKFGADFLVYLGDPIAYHAIFIVHCVEDPNSPIHSTEIVAFGRLASAVKKRAVLATVKDAQVAYITLNWIDA